MLVDGEPLYRGRSPAMDILPDSAYLQLSGRSLGIEILLGPVTLYRGVRYGLAAGG